MGDLEKPDPPAVQQSRALLNKTLKVLIKDGRELFGRLTCIDQQGNLILADSYENYAVDGRCGLVEKLHGCWGVIGNIEWQQTKRMGNILVPLNQRVACHALLEPEAHTELVGMHSSPLRSEGMTGAMG